MFTFLLVIHALVSATLVTVILMQRSEGGGLGMGGSPSGLMSARGAADFLTRATTILATVFILLSIVLAVVAATRHSAAIDTSLAQRPGAAQDQAATTASGEDPLAAAAANATAANSAAPANDSVPLAQ